MPYGGARKGVMPKLEGTEDWNSYQFEIVRKEVCSIGPRIATPSSLAEYFYMAGLDLMQECLWVAILNGKNDLIGINQVYKGTATGTSVNVAEIIRPVLATSGVGFAIVHNHPSGDTESSEADLQLTRDVLKACKLMDIQMVDHLIVGNGSYTSMRAETARDMEW